MENSADHDQFASLKVSRSGSTQIHKEDIHVCNLFQQDMG